MKISPAIYREELHGNDILLLAYYIAGMNIEQAYYKRLPDAPYETFNRLLLTDTFNLDESEGLLADIFPRQPAAHRPSAKLGHTSDCWQSTLLRRTAQRE